MCDLVSIKIRPGARIAWLGGGGGGGGRNKFWGAREVYLCKFERGTGAREIYPSLDQMSKVKTKASKGFSGQNREFKRFFQPKAGDLKKKKKRFSSPKCHEIRCQSTKFTKIPMANTNLSLDLYSSSPELVNFFGAQSSLGGHNFRLWGHGPGMPPRGAGSDQDVQNFLPIGKKFRAQFRLVPNLWWF